MGQFDEVLGVLLPIVDLLCIVAYAATKRQTLVNNGEEALEHGFTHVFADPVRVERIHAVVIQRVLQVEEADGGENVDDHHGEQTRTQQLVRVQRHGLHHVSQRWESWHDIQQLQAVVELVAQEA